MADLIVVDDELIVDLTGFEELEAFHGTIQVPVVAVRQVRDEADRWPELRGAPGTGIPGVAADAAGVAERLRRDMGLN